MKASSFAPFGDWLFYVHSHGLIGGTVALSINLTHPNPFFRLDLKGYSVQMEIDTVTADHSPDYPGQNLELWSKRGRCSASLLPFSQSPLSGGLAQFAGARAKRRTECICMYCTYMRSTDTPWAFIINFILHIPGTLVRPRVLLLSRQFIRWPYGVWISVSVSVLRTYVLRHRRIYPWLASLRLPLSKFGVWSSIPPSQ